MHFRPRQLFHLCFQMNFMQYPRLVVPTYLIAGVYCLADATSAGYQIMSEDDSKKHATDGRSKEVRAAIAGFDTLVWQGKN